MTIGASTEATDRAPLDVEELAPPDEPAALGEPLRHAELLHDVIDTRTATGGAQKFPEAASRRISFSSVRSETAFRSRSFSFSSSFSRFT